LLDLDAYLTGEMNEADADAVEEAMFDAPDDADLAFVDRFVRDGARLSEHGTFDMGVSRAHVESMIAAGHKVQIIDIGPPGSGTVALAPDADFVVTKLAFGRTDLDRVDVEIVVVDHQVTKTIKDAFVDTNDGMIYALCERALAELAFGAGRTITKVRRRDGAREVLATWDLGPA
jgi:hypothetical protein